MGEEHGVEVPSNKPPSRDSWMPAKVRDFLLAVLAPIVAAGAIGIVVMWSDVQVIKTQRVEDREYAQAQAESAKRDLDGMRGEIKELMGELQDSRETMSALKALLERSLHEQDSRRRWPRK